MANRAVILACIAFLTFSYAALAEEEQDSRFIIETKSALRLDTFPEWVSASKFSPDGQWLAVGSYQDVRLYAIEDGTIIRKSKHNLKNKSGYVRSLAFLPKSKLLAVGSYQSIEIVSLETGRVQQTIKAHRGDVTDIIFLPDGKTAVSSSDDETVHVWNVADWSKVRSFSGHKLPVYGIALSPDGSLLASVTGDEFSITQPGRVRLFDFKTGELKQTLEEHQKQATDVAFSNDGKLLITTSVDEKTNVYKTEDGTPLGFFGGHSRPVNGIVVLPDGKTAITCSGGRFKGKCEVIVWKIASGDEDFKFEPHGEKVTSIALSPDGKRLATTSQDKTVLVFTITEKPVEGTAKPDDMNQPDEKKTDGQQSADDIPPAPAKPENAE